MASIWSPVSPPPPRRRTGTARCGSWRSISGVKATMVRRLAALGGSRGAGRHHGRRGARPRARRVFLSNGPVTRPRSAGRATPSPNCWAGSPSSGSAWAINCWPPRLAAPPTSCPSGTTAPTIRCSGWTPGGRDHQPEPQLRRGRRFGARYRVTHVNLNDGVIEGIRSRRVRRSRCSTTRRRRRALTMPATSSLHSCADAAHRHERRTR